MKNVLNNGQKPWSNLTISIKNSRFKIEYNYDNLIGGQDAYYDHHIYWRYKYLHIEPQGKKRKRVFLISKGAKKCLKNAITNACFLKMQNFSR